jgi:hypothetical protein
VPEGYLESLATRRNLIVHPGLQRYYGALRTIVSDPVLSPNRLRTLWSFWCGDYDEGLAAYVREAYDATPTPVVPAAQFAESAAEGTHWAHCATPRVLREGGLRVSWPAPRTVRLLHLAVDSDEDYVVHFECNGRGLGSVTLHALRGAYQGITNHAVPAPQVPFDTIWLVAGGSADQVAVLASVRLE